MKTMLIAVGSDVIRGALAETFQAEYNVYTCSCSDRALMILSKERPDVLIIDLSLPDITGISVLQKTEHVPPVILALTYFISDDVIQAAHSVGIQVLLRLPCTVNHIRSQIKKLQVSHNGQSSL